MERRVAASPIEQQIAELAAPVAETLGLEIVRVRMTGGDRAVLQIMTERPDGGVHIDECAALSRELSAILDVEVPIQGRYALEVSSPGIDRPLTREKDFAAFAGHVAKVETAVAIDGRRRWRGTLLGLEDGPDGKLLRMELDGGEIAALPLDQVSGAKLVLTDALIEATKTRAAAAGGEKE
mgnify:FL=1